MTWNPKTDMELQDAVQAFLSKNDYILSDNAEYEPVIDGVHIMIGADTVLRVGLPPVTNYNIRETEHTEKHLRKRELVSA